MQSSTTFYLILLQKATAAAVFDEVLTGKKTLTVTRHCLIYALTFYNI
jgi:hypothetical protein